MALGNFTYKTVPLLGLTFDFAWDGARTMLRDVRVRHASGELLADALDAPGDFRLKLESSINPAALRPIVRRRIAKFLGEWEWPRSPAVRLAVRGTSRHPETWHGDGTVALQRMRFRGVWANSVRADVRFGEGALTFNNLRVVRDEGVGSGSFTYDFKQHEVRLQNIRTTLRPTDVIYWVEPKLFKVVAPYKFKAPPTRGRERRRAISRRQEHPSRARRRCPGRDWITFSSARPCPSEPPKGNLLITHERVQLLSVSGALFGGLVRGTADISVAENDRRYSARVSVEGANFPKLTDLYFDYQTARGELFGDYEWTSVGDDARARCAAPAKCGSRMATSLRFRSLGRSPV